MASLWVDSGPYPEARTGAGEMSYALETVIRTPSENMDGSLRISCNASFQSVDSVQ